MACRCPSCTSCAFAAVQQRSGGRARWLDICGGVRASSRQIQRPVGMSSAHMRTEHARSQPKTPCMSLASSTRRAINLFRILNCRFHMNEQEVAKIRHRMANTCYELKFDPKHPVVGLECAAQMGTHERDGRSTQVRRHGSSGRRSVSCRSKPGCLRPPARGRRAPLAAGRAFLRRACQP